MKIGLKLATLLALVIPSAGLENTVLATNAEAQQASPSLTHARHVTSGFPGAPGGRGLVLTASEETNTAMMHANFAAGDLTDLAYMQTHVRHMLHALDPQEGDQGPGLGFGVRQALEAAIGGRVMAARTAPEAAPLVAELRDLALQLDTGSGTGPEGRNGMNHVEDEAYSILIGEGQLRILQ